MSQPKKRNLQPSTLSEWHFLAIGFTAAYVQTLDADAHVCFEVGKEAGLAEAYGAPIERVADGAPTLAAHFLSGYARGHALRQQLNARYPAVAKRRASP